MNVAGNSGRQLPLSFFRNEAASFDNFVAGPNGEALAAMRQAGEAAGPAFVYLWGAAGTGKTHLLQAACARAAGVGRRAFYLPLSEANSLSPSVCDDLEMFDLVCLDGMDTIAGQLPWEQALFRLYNRLRDRHAALAISGRRNPREPVLALPDLGSRLVWGLVFQLRALDDIDKRDVLVRRARQRGMELPEDVIDYLLARVRRDLPALCGLLDRLDWESLSSQRRLSVPFVKAVLEAGKESENRGGTQ
jgi:DnaA family protein